MKLFRFDQASNERMFAWIAQGAHCTALFELDIRLVNGTERTSCHPLFTQYSWYHSSLLESSTGSTGNHITTLVLDRMITYS